MNKFASILKSTLAHFGKRIVGDAADEAAGVVVDGAVQLVTSAARFTVALITADTAEVAESTDGLR